MATLEDIQAAIASRREPKLPATDIAAPTPSVAPVTPDPAAPLTADLIQAEIRRRNAPDPNVPNVDPEFAAERVLDAPPSRETDATRDLPELGQGGLLSNRSLGEVNAIASVLISTTDPREIGQILTNQFPEIGIQEDEAGNLIAGNNETGAKVVINKPGASMLDVLQAIGIGSQFIPSAQVAALGRTTLQKAGIAAAGAGVTQGAVEAAQAATGGEFDEDEIALAVALGGASETLVPIVQNFRRSRIEKQAQAAGEQIEDVADNVSRGTEASESTGIELTPAQRTAIPSQLDRQALIAQLPGGTADSVRFLRRQNAQSAQAVEDVLIQIAPDEAVTGAQEQLRTASQRAIEAAKQVRAEKASPFYEAAKAENAEVDLTPVTALIDETLAEFPESGQVAKAFKRVQKMLGSGSGVRVLHNTKLEIDQMIDKVGDGSLGNTTKSQLGDLKNLLLDQMDEASDLYRQARETFEAASPPVNRITDSIVGKIASLDDVQLRQVTGLIFNPNDTARAVTAAKKAIQEVDPDAWNAIFRAEIERRLGNARTNLGDGQVENLPRQMLSAIFGNEKSKQVLISGADGEVKKNLKYLETALSRAAKGRTQGSQTAARTEILREIRDSSTAISQWFRSPIDSLRGIGEEAAFDAKVRAMAKAMFDPEFKPEMAKIRKLDVDSPAAGRALFQLFDDAVASDIANARQSSGTGEQTD